MIDILNLPGLQVVEVKEEPQQYSILAEADDVPAFCDKCCRNRMYAHGARSTTFVDIPLHGKMVAIAIKRRRWHCQDCRAITIQALPEMSDAHQMTKRLVGHVERMALDKTFADVAKETGLDERTIRRITDDYIHRLESKHVFQTPSWLGLDEIHLGKACLGVVANVKDRCLVEMLPNRSKETVRNYIANVLDPQKIKVVTMDMWRPYRDVVMELCPEAEVVVDRFHVVRMANNALDVVRKKIRKELSDADRIQLKNDRPILFKRFKDLNEKQRAVLNGWTKAHPTLGKAYVAKESYLDIWDARDAKTARAYYGVWLENLPKEVVTNFKPLVTAMKNWDTEIFRYFKHRATNGYVEGLNSVTKQVYRRGRGYTYEVLRAKMLFVHGQHKVTQRIQKRPVGFFEGRSAGFGSREFTETLEWGVPLDVLAGLVERW